MISLDRISATGTPSAPAIHPTSTKKHQQYTQNQPAIDPAPARSTPRTRPHYAQIPPVIRCTRGMNIVDRMPDMCLTAHIWKFAR